MKKILIYAILLMTYVNLQATDYYSIDSGSFFEPDTWSTTGHDGEPDGNVPGENPDDNVIIGNGHEIILNFGNTSINNVTINDGSLNFQRGSGIKANQVLFILGDLTVEENGRIGEVNDGTRYDTLVIEGSIHNNSSGNNGIFLNHDFEAAFTVLFFSGVSSTIVEGEGNWSLKEVILDKREETSNVLANYSESFSIVLSESIVTQNGEFNIVAGAYFHSNDEEIVFTPDDNQSDFFLEDKCGIAVQKGTVTFLTNLTTGKECYITISGGALKIGNNIDENFLYGEDFSLKIFSGEMIVAGRFSFIEDNSSIDMQISGGNLTVMDKGAEQTGTDLYGFAITAISSVTWNFDDNPDMLESRIIYSKSMPEGNDCSILAETFEIRGGTFQVGVEENMLKGKKAVLFDASMPIWNLDIIETRHNDGSNQALIIQNNDLRIFNNLYIGEWGGLDMNCHNLRLRGDFINWGRFSPDGNGGLDDGDKAVILLGDKEQTIFIENEIINEQSSDEINNEPFFDLVVDKTGTNNVIIGDGATHPVIRNTLVFADANTAFINARANAQDIEIDPRDDSELGDVYQFGEFGHVDGRLILPAGTEDEEIEFIIGTGENYTPATLHLKESGGTEGKISMISYPHNPDNIDDNEIGLDLTRNIQRYWQIEPHNNFDLADRNYDLVLFFQNPDDLRNGAETDNLRQVYCSDTPYTILDHLSNGEDFVKSQNNTLFGDVMIGHITPEAMKYISGYVRSSVDDQPIQNADVKCIDPVNNDIITVSTDEDGYYEAGLIEGRTYFILAETQNYNYMPQFYDENENYMEAMPLTMNNDMSDIDFSLKQRPETGNKIYGAVTDGDDNGIPVFIILLMVESYDSTNALQTKCMSLEAISTSGLFSFDNILPGRYVLLAYPQSKDYVPGYYKEGEPAVLKWFESSEFEVLEDENIGPVKFLMEKVTPITGIGTIKGQVIGEELSIEIKGDSPLAKKSVSGAMTFTVDENEKVRTYDKTNQNGSYIMPNVDTGKYVVVFDKFGYAANEKEVEITNDRDVNVDVDLVPGTGTPVYEFFITDPETAKVFPNPNNGEVLNIDFISNSINADISIIDILGNEIFKYEVQTGLGRTQIKLSGINLSSGTYIVRIKTGFSVYNIPLVISG